MMRLWEAGRRLGLTLALCLALGSSPATAGEDDHHAAHLPPAAGAKIAVADDPARGVMQVRLGPLALPARSDHGAVAQAPDLFFALPFDGWLVAYHPRLTDGSGRALPGRLLHHVAFWHTARRDFLCPNKPEHLFGAGGEMNDWPAVPGYGYPVRRGDRIRIETMFHNPTEVDYPEVYLEVAIEYRRAGNGQPPLQNFYPAWFDVQGCRDSGYDLPPGESVAAAEFRLRHGGILLGVGGHLHDFGRRLLLVNLSRQETIADLEPRLDAEGRLLSIPVVSFAEQEGYRLAAGELLRVSATYDNPTGRVLPAGAMGIVVGYFVPEEGKALEDLRR